jgi:xanthine/uracil permease
VTHFSDSSCTTPVSSSYLVGIIENGALAKVNQCYMVSKENFSDKNVEQTCGGGAFTTAYYTSGCGATPPYLTYSEPTGVCMQNEYGDGTSSMNFCK